MAKNRNGIMGQMTGKIGTVVGIVDKWGRSYYRAADVEAVDPKTPAQLRHRSKISTVSKLSKALGSSLANTMFYHGIQMKTTPRNAFIKANMDKFLYEPLRFDFDNLVLGFGRLATPILTIGEAGQDPGSHPLITATLPEPDNVFPLFKIALCLFCPETMESKTAMVDVGARFRTTIPDGWRQHGYYLYGVTAATNNSPVWLPTQYTSGGRIMQAHETSDTFRIAINGV